MSAAAPSPAKSPASYRARGVLCRLQSGSCLEMCSFEGLLRPFAPHFHDHVVVGLLLHGERRVSVDGQSRTLHRGEVMLVPAGAIHACTPLDGRSTGWLSLNIPPDLLRERARHLGVTPLHFHAPVSPDPELCRLMQELALALHDPHPETVRVAAGLARATISRAAADEGHLSLERTDADRRPAMRQLVHDLCDRLLLEHCAVVPDDAVRDAAVRAKRPFLLPEPAPWPGPSAGVSGPPAGQTGRTGRACGPTCPQGPAPAAADPVARIRRLCSYLRAHPDTHLGLADLGAGVGMSVPTLLRAFRAITGTTPHRYLTSLRLIRAGELLRQGHPPLEVALQLGFADQSHLNRVFAACTGFSPGQYRRAFGPA